MFTFDEILGVNDQQQTAFFEPSKKKYKSMEDQFADSDERVDFDPMTTTMMKNDES